MNRLEQTFTICAVFVIALASFFVGTQFQMWRTTDRVKTFHGAAEVCENIISHDAYIKTHKEVNRGILLDDCIKYVMKEGAN